MAGASQDLEIVKSSFLRVVGRGDWRVYQIVAGVQTRLLMTSKTQSEKMY